MGRKRCGGLLALGLLGCLSAQAASPVWAIRGDHNTLYLAGSVHLLKANESALPAGFERAYGASRSLVMELDLGKIDPAEIAGWMTEHGTLAPGTDLHALLGDERYRRVTAAAQRLGLPMELAGQFAPWVLGLQLLELQYAQLGFDSESGVEQQLEHRAEADGKPTGGLETVAEQLGVFEQLSTQEQAKFLDLVVTEMQDVDGDTRAVVTAWRAGDAKQLAGLLSDEYKSFPSLYRALVTDRNRRWVPEIEKLLQGKENCLVVVGALHLVGAGGLLELLRRDGYQAEQLN